MFVERAEPEYRVNGRETYWSVQCEDWRLELHAGEACASCTLATAFCGNVPAPNSSYRCAEASGAALPTVQRPLQHRSVCAWGLDITTRDAVKVKRGWREWDRQDCVRGVSASLHKKNTSHQRRHCIDCGYAWCTSCNTQRVGSTPIVGGRIKVK
eukprot:4531226-Amphidinium_carterae.2